MNKSGDYHDYVFKNGKLVGDFEGMYRYSAVTPWHQDRTANEWYTEIAIVMLKEKAPYNKILEIGCGLGYFAKKLKRMGKDIDAFDISATAIKKAKTLHKGIHFYIDDITKKSFNPLRRYDLVVAKDIFWYVFPELEDVFANIKKCIKPKKFLFVSQSFPALNTNFVGKDIISDPETLIDLLVKKIGIEPINAIFVRRFMYKADGPTLHFLGLKI
ncbi:MAG TPA: class I SAM-dependent methyltransferase [Victivallales bacterium]|nr:class I SAM-dependent methyltransferase [Victivallales bacterium]